MRDVLIDTFQEWFHIDDLVPFDVIMATALAIFFPGDPLWTMVVGSPGSGKTEMVRAFNGNYIYTLDTLTSNTLVSGLRDNKTDKKSGILPDIDGKLVIIKDLTVMLPQVTNDSSNNVFHQLRAAYDGEYAAAHGSGMKRQHYRSKFGLIAAVTPAVDKFRTLNSALGERFLTVRVRPDAAKSIMKAQFNCGREVEMREDLTHIMKLTTDFYRDEGQRNGLPVICPDNLKKIAALGELVAKLRSDVDRDKFRHVVTQPQPEIGTRLVKQLTRLSGLLSLYGAYNYTTLTRVGKDCVPPLRLQVLEELYKKVSETPYGLAKCVECSYGTVKEICEDMWMLKILQKTTKGRGDSYSYYPEVLELIWASEIFGV